MSILSSYSMKKFSPNKPVKNLSFSRVCSFEFYEKNLPNFLVSELEISENVAISWLGYLNRQDTFSACDIQIPALLWKRQMYKSEEYGGGV